ncbi:MAG: proline dehydrogenase family protein [Gemmatimonadota bacterium]|nr:proline dehydrogenase family protein [Gemmatimonadota bacterium]
MAIMRGLLLKGSRSEWLATKVRQRGFAQRAVRRFMPGETVEAALAATEELRGQSISTILTLLGEAITTKEEAESVTAHYLDVYDRIERGGYPARISVKPTQLGLDVGRAVCQAQLKRLAERAAAAGSLLWIDMEASPYVDATLEMYRELRDEFDNVAVCLQAYLYRTAADLEALMPSKPTIRLVKGAYAEPADLAYPRKEDVDAAFMRLAKRLLSADARSPDIQHAFGTHDMQLITRIRDYADGAEIAKDSYEIQMLYGIRRYEQTRLSASGVPVRVLISYGSEWFPWYMRRLAERPANLMFVVRSLFAR